MLHRQDSIMNPENNLLHVFIINGPISLIASRMIIDEFEIKEADIFLSCSRKTDTSLINPLSFNPISYWYDRYFEKILSINLKGHRILNKILGENRNFILYSAWAELETEKIIASKYCKGHIYIEEGQMAYWKVKPFKYKRKFIFMRMIENIYLHLTNSFERFTEDHDRHYRDDAMAYIGLTPNAFPLVPNEKRFILNNYESLKNHYKPKLLGIKTIGLTCAERRLDRSQWKSMLKTLVKRMPNGGVIKLHPSFSMDNKKVDKLKSLLSSMNTQNIKICDDAAIIEIEMLFENKQLIGPLTSVSIYSEVFGSDFEYVDLY